MAETSLEIVVGIDFGTTYSGVSWAVNGGTKQIRLINNWPDPEAQVASPQKVPSSICYQGDMPPIWGYDVGMRNQSFKWIKILLETNHKYAEKVKSVKASNSLLSSTNKTAQDVVTDYLKALWNYTLDDIRNYREDFDPDVFSIRVVLTVPAMWSLQAKDKTLRAAKDAGMPGKIRLVSEPEAAALATLKGKLDEGTLHVGDTFVVCDAGGGTVDLISYKVTALDPLKMRECAIGSGDLCGSVYLDQAFQRYIRTLVGESQWANIRESSKKRMMRQFEYGIKRSFAMSSTRQYSVELVGVEDDPEHDIYDDTITLSTSALKGVFDEVLDRVKDLVSDQVAAVLSKKLLVKAVLLVGGFGECRYLLERLKGFYSESDIRVLQVAGAWSSICRGATMWGLEHFNHTTSLQAPLQRPTVGSRLSRYSYGIALNEIYDATRHRGAQTYVDSFNGHRYAADRMCWFLKKGEEIKDGARRSFDAFQTVKVGLFNSGSRSFCCTILSCEDDVAPASITDSVKPLCSLSCTIDANQLRRATNSWQSPVNGRSYRDAKFKITVAFGNSLEFMVLHEGREVGRVSASYLD